MEEQIMKKLFISLAALAALASCVEENNLEPQPQPQQPQAENTVTIKAVAAQTKTLLNGTAVEWEDDDAIKVVLVDKEFQDFNITAIDQGTATFQGKFDTEISEAEKAYAVYPATAVADDGGVIKISHTVPAEQTGTITSGMNLSFAELEVSELSDGTADASFHNALTLLKVIVPEGVKTVSLTSSNDGIVGTTDFNVPQNGTMTRKSVQTGRTVTLTNETGLQENNDVLVYPANTGNLTLTMEGLDGTTYEKTLTGVVFQASEYRTINLKNIFSMPVKATEQVSPMGGTVEFEIVAAEQYDYVVDIEDTPDWITLNDSAHVKTKAFAGTTVSFDVKANTTGESREAKVTITWDNGEEQSKTFTISQASAYLDFVYVDAKPANELIQWQENFAVYSSEANALNQTNPTKGPYTNTFNIELSDNPEKGAYMITNMFYADSYYDANYQPVNGKGAKYYADYADGILTVKKNDGGNSYYFSGNISLTYDSENKTFTAAPIPTTSNNVWIGGYTAEVKQNDPGTGDEGGDDDESPYAYLCTQYTENLTGAVNGTPSPGILTIALSDNESYDLKMTFFGGTSTEVTVYANVSDDGKTLTTVKPAGYTNMGTFYESTLTLSDLSSGGPIWGTLKFDFPSSVEYTAFKK